ncbi:MAG: hypothetical protein JNK99_04150 [Candidatus Accumulibacter sp.]|jgi:hypothetical protein|uniref:hypothetical protein n=1 Tax=Accumulibacter sp. TaxID=2053492 RepID=UPI001A3630DF|nr:hypothetical protein [Accumulibacter sp.]MBL8393932.1 hypothetical protein [Accumulibacter sp.]
MTKNLLLDAAILLALAIVAVVGYKLAPLLNPKPDIALPLSNCDLNQQACVATLPDGGQIEFSIEPRPIPPLRPLQLEASFNGTEVRKVEVDLAGSTMKMGYNRPRLERRSGGSERFVGVASLPVCITGSMEWEATVLVDTGKAVVALPFRFVTGQ